MHGNALFRLLGPTAGGMVSTERFKSFLAILALPETQFHEYQTKFKTMHDSAMSLEASAEPIPTPIPTRPTPGHQPSE